MASVQSKTSLLTYTGTNKVLMPNEWDVWPMHAVVKSFFRSVVNELPLGAVASFESAERDEEDAYQNLFKGNNEGEGVFINPLSILRMPIEKAEAVWTEIFLSPSRRAIRLTILGEEGMTVLGNAAKMLAVGANKALM